MTHLLAVRDLSVSFGRQRVLHDVSFQLAAGQRLGLIGESGSGKSLTALAVLGLLPDAARTSGSVQLEGRELLGLADRELARIRGRRVAMVFQEPMTALDPTMKVGRQVAEVVRLHQHASERGLRGSNRGRPGSSRGRPAPGQGRPAPAQGRPESTDSVSTSSRSTHSTREVVLQMLRSVELTDAERIADRYPHQLSGGQRQRVVLAMALVNRPDLLICDEPTTALDVTVQARVLTLLDASLRDREAACLFISHDLAVVAQVCTDVLVMLDGRIVDSGPVAHVLGNPRHPYTAGLVATARLDLVEPGQRLPILADFYRPDQAKPDPAPLGELA